MGQTNQNTENLSQELVYDYVFIGMGASNSLILKKLIESNLFNAKKVAVIEATKKNEKRQNLLLLGIAKRFHCK